MNANTPRFTALDRVEISGRGTVFSVLNPHECMDFEHLIGQIVDIDGTAYRVLGVERFLHMPPWRKDEPIGLLVEESK